MKSPRYDSCLCGGSQWNMIHRITFYKQKKIWKPNRLWKWCVLFSSNFHNKIPCTGWLKQKKSTSSQLWRLEVWDQGARMFKFWGELSSYLADRHHLTVPSHCRERKSKLSGVSSYKGTYLTIKVPPSWPHLNLITSQRPHLQIPTHWGLGPQHMNSRDTI